MSFDDLLAANRKFAADFDRPDLPGAAAAGLAVVTCMDSRIDPLKMLGLGIGDAKIVRNPGGQVTNDALTAVVLAVNLLGAERVMVVQHTRCAMASAPEPQLQQRLTDASGQDASWLHLGAIDGPEDTVRRDVAKVAAHPLVPDAIEVAGFIYDVDTGLLNPVT